MTHKKPFVTRRLGESLSGGVMLLYHTNPALSTQINQVIQLCENCTKIRIGAAYIRVSDERQDEYSPDSQLKKIREYAAKEGYQIPDDYVFYDDRISGKFAELHFVIILAPTG